MRHGAEKLYPVRPSKLKRDNKNENFRGCKCYGQEGCNPSSPRAFVMILLPCSSSALRSAPKRNLKESSN
jgi:hypothetical protein